MSRIMMIYHIPEGDAATRITFNRKLFSYAIQSHGGKYRQKSKGILSEYEKPVRSCVIFDATNVDSVIKLCRHLKIRFKLYKIDEIALE